MRRKLSYSLVLVMVLNLLMGMGGAKAAEAPFVISTMQPANGSKGVSIDPKSILLTFDRGVRPGQGTIEVIADGETAPTFSETITPQGFVSMQYEIRLPRLDYNRVYHVKGSAGTFVDANNPAITSEAFDLSFTTLSSAESRPPVISRVTPAEKATITELTQLLQIEFDKTIAKGSGNIRVKRVSNNEVVFSAAVQDSAVSVNGNAASWQVDKLLSGESYYVEIDQGAFVDSDHQPFAGIQDGDRWRFNVRGSAVAWNATTPFVPASNASNVSINSSIQLNFSRAVYPNTGNIILQHRSSGTPVTIPVTSSDVKGGGTTQITITPPALTYNSVYTVTVPQGAFRDSDGNETIERFWNFTTGTANSTSLSIASLTPTSNSSNNAVTTKIAATFSKNYTLVDRSKVTLKKQGTTTLINAEARQTSTRELTVTPSSSLQEGTTYIVEIASGAIVDAETGANYTGTSWTFHTGTVDKTAPVLQSATMHSNTAIRLVYNKTLDSSYNLSTSSFTVNVNGENRRISSAYASGENVYVYLETGVAVGQNIRISYSGTGRLIQDTNGNKAASFTSKEVTNGIDSVMPKPQEGYISGSTLTLRFSESLKDISSYAYQQFTVTADGQTKSIDRINKSGSYVYLYLNSSVSNGDIVKVSYTPGSYPLQDYRGQNIAAFSDYFVRNYNDSRAPEFTKVEGSSNKIVITYNEALRSTSIPMKSQYSVLVNNSPVYVTNIEVSTNQVTLTLASSFTKEQYVTLSYVSGVGGIADLNGNLAGYINLEPVTYNMVADGVRSAVVRGDTITITHTGTLRSSGSISANQFSVNVDQGYTTVQSASLSGDTITLKLGTSVSASQVVELSYTPGSAPLYDHLGNAMKAYSRISVQNLTGGGTSNGTGTGVSSLPSFLTVFPSSEFDLRGYLLNANTAKAQEVVSASKQRYIKRYEVDSAKLQEAYQFIMNSNTADRKLVFQVPSTEKMAEVALPIGPLLSAYGQGKTGSIAIWHQDVIYELPIEKIPFSQISRSLFANNLNSAYITVQIDPMASTQMPPPINNNGVTTTPLRDPVQVNVAAYNSNAVQNVVDVDHEGRIHFRVINQGAVPQGIMSQGANNYRALIKHDFSSRTSSFVPASVKQSGNYVIFNGKISGKEVVGPARGYSYFTDTGSHWANDSIVNLASRLIIDGRQNGRFEPNSNITRAEFAVFIAKGLGLTADEGNVNRFPDVPRGTTGDYIGAAAKAGIIAGNTDGTFKPNSYITREQMALMMVRAMNYAGYEISLNGSSAATLNRFKDNNKIYSKDNVAKAVKEGIIQGVSLDTFQPQGNATRAQAAVMLKRVLEKLNYI
ncbi:Ig-like domain-containing protein [Paenibacillus fonticola]|uniref:Ig-like domain-containing protein n=1 Tax=Paenibacillus fonticola TaxID=379896 RepID=UPI000368C31F|nr:Ig-like domain-containing protein [Paenibacillus fonticola]